MVPRRRLLPMIVPLALAGLSLAIWLYLLLAHGGFWREAPRAAPQTTRQTAPRWPEVVAVVPARDEAESIAAAIGSLLQQRYSGRISVVLVDDHSSDDTGAIARDAARAIGAEDRLTVIAARDLPAGWTGKLWAIQEGLRHLAASGSTAELVLLTDADIAHHPENLAELVARMETGGLDLASLMVLLRCESFAERALIPAFVFFFEMLYPFAWVNDPSRSTAGAAGGCMLVRRAALARIGGIASIRDALIDDCALARKIKAGGPIWLGLTAKTRSLRRYPGLGDIWRMIARTAYTQLDHSPILLGATVLGLALCYLAPPVLVFAGGAAAPVAGLAWLAMTIAFVPILRLYGQPLVIAPTLPIIALFYLAATIDSARRHWQGRGGEWKGRVQQRGPA
jgi:hopene-associated glycosyltransferase HpnB